jgi:hypothetical protein
MTDESSKQHHSGEASGEDLKRILGDIDKSRVIEILALKPTLAEVEEAAAYASGDGDIQGKSGHSLTGVVAQIVDILAADDEDPEAAMYP